jgi:hypothetical protein
MSAHHEARAKVRSSDEGGGTVDQRPGHLRQQKPQPLAPRPRACPVRASALECSHAHWNEETFPPKKGGKDPPIYYGGFAQAGGHSHTAFFFVLCLRAFRATNYKQGLIWVLSQTHDRPEHQGSWF